MTAYKSQPQVRVSFRGTSFIDYHVNLVTLHTYYKLQKLIFKTHFNYRQCKMGHNRNSQSVIQLNCMYKNVDDFKVLETLRKQNCHFVSTFLLQGKSYPSTHTTGEIVQIGNLSGLLSVQWLLAWKTQSRYDYQCHSRRNVNKSPGVKCYPSLCGCFFHVSMKEKLAEMCTKMHQTFLNCLPKQT